MKRKIIIVVLVLLCFVSIILGVYFIVDECDKKYGKYNPVPRPYRNK